MQKSDRLVLLVIFSTILVSCSLQKNSFLQNIAADYKNPHTDCAHCHGIQDPKGGKVLFPPEVEPSELCLDCHSYAENHHPVDYVPLTPVKPLFPLYGRKVRCLSCHGIHGGDQHYGTPKLLRGGPYADRRTICFYCHSKEKYTEINPHRMLDSKGNIKVVNGKPVCLFCHEVTPDPSQDRASNVYFRADIGFLCWRCHPPMPGAFDHEHFLVRPSMETMAYINRPEVQEKFTLPMVPWGRINCSTCHNPHQAGVILTPPAAAGAGAAKRLRDNNICAACHIY